MAEHVASLTGVAAVFQLQPDVPRATADIPSSVPLLDADRAPEAAESLNQIASWSAEALGIQHVPAVWRALAHQPGFLRATWNKDRLVMSGGTLDELTKACAALAVASFRQSPYFVAYFLQLLRVRCVVDDQTISEIAASVGHYLAFNTIAHGMQLEAQFSDMSAADFEPDGRYGGSAMPGGR